MKKFVFVLFIIALSATKSFSQTQRYCELKGIEKDFSSGLKIIFDFGNISSYNIWGDLSGKLKFVNENGEVIYFNSMVDAANYMVNKGWKFQQAYFSIYGGHHIIHWIFLQRRRKL